MIPLSTEIPRTLISSTWRQVLELARDVLERVDPIFYGDVRQAAFKALGLN